MEYQIVHQRLMSMVDVGGVSVQVTIINEPLRGECPYFGHFHIRSPHTTPVKIEGPITGWTTYDEAFEQLVGLAKGYIDGVSV